VQAGSFAERLRAGERLTGMFVKAPAAAQVELTGAHGYDYVVIDTEHGAGGGAVLEDHLRAADAGGVAALVRVPGPAPEYALSALDAGATGIIVPHVITARDAEAAVQAAHYPPLGRRGLALSTRAARYGTVALDEHLRHAEQTTLVIVQIEDAPALAHATDIATVPGVDAILVGVSDLSLSLGHPGQASHPVVIAAIATIVAAARAAGRPLMAVLGDPAEAPQWRARGASALSLVAVNLIRDAFADASAQLREPAIGGPEPVLLLPGMLGGPALWSDVLDHLPGVRPVIGRIDLDDSVAEMASTALAQAPPRFALAGHSLGAIVALEIVRRAPERVTRLALLNASARGAGEAQMTEWTAMDERVAAGGFAEVLREFSEAGVAGARQNTAPLGEQLIAMGDQVGAAGLRRQLRAQIGRPDARPWLGRIRCPVLVISGGADRVSPPALQAELAAGIPGARLLELEDCGHAAPLEQPGPVAAAFARWLGPDAEGPAPGPSCVAG
jgi:4-hydroxy-2-oxoheptanedioate aldolase